MCGSQILPGQIGAIEHLDVASLIAPRRVARRERRSTTHLPGRRRARRRSRRCGRVYAQLGAPDDALVHDVFDGGHMWHGTETSAFLERWL